MGLWSLHALGLCYRDQTRASPGRATTVVRALDASPKGLTH